MDRTQVIAPRSLGDRCALALVAASLAVPLILLPLADGAVPTPVRAAGWLLWAACLAPTIVCLLRAPERRRPVPLLPLIGLVYGLYFGLPAALGAANLQPFFSLDPARAYGPAVYLALLGWLCLLWGYWAATAFEAFERGATSRTWDPVALRRWTFIFLSAGLAADLLQAAGTIPNGFDSAVHFLSTLTWFGAGMWIALHDDLGLGVAGQVTAFALVGFAFLLQMATGLVSNAAFLLLALLLARWLVRRRISLDMLVLGGLLISILVVARGVIGEYRAIAWEEDPGMELAERLSVLSNLGFESVDRLGFVDTVERGGRAVIGRSAHLDVLADVIGRTPDKIPYWGGRTYVSLPSTFIPRILWPQKPSKELGQDFGHRYGYLAPSDRATSFNLPYPVEAYANFGLWGVPLVMIVAGAVYGLLVTLLDRPRQDRVISLAAIVLFLPLLNIESDFSLVFGSLVVHGVGLAGVLWLLRQTAARGPTGPNQRPVSKDLSPALRLPSSSDE